MDSNPFRTVRGYLNHAPAAKWTAITSSVAAAVLLAAFFPLLYLFADLLVCQGYVPGYDGLTAPRQAKFRAEWEAGLADDAAVQEALAKVRPAGLPKAAALPEGTEWEFRWRAATYAWFAAAVGKDAAEAYLPLEATADGTPAPPRVPLGPLAPLAKARNRWDGRAVGALARVAPWTWQPTGGQPATVPYLTGLFAAAFGLALVRGLLLNLSAHAAALCTREAVTRLRRGLVTHAYRLPTLAIKPEAQAEAGELVSTRVEHIQDGFLAWLSMAFRGPVQAAVAVVAAVLVHPLLGAALFLLGLLVWLVAGQVVAWYRQDARVAARRTESRLGLLRESLNVCQLVKGYLMDRYSQTRVERHLAELGRAAWRRQRGDAVSRAGLTIAGSLTGLVMLYLAARVVLAGDLTVPGLAVEAAALAALLAIVTRWLTARTRIARARGAAADVVEFLDRRGEPGQSIEAEFLQPLTKRLDVVEVSLREAGTGRMLLEGVSLSVPAGSRAAVVYSDPDEAHALAFLLTRFLDPTAGEVRIDGRNVRWVTTESLRTQVCLVLEQSLTFTDTAANNIGCGDPGFTLPQIIEAAKLSHAHQFIQTLPYGYETPVGVGGVTLTAGQRFRVALARALLRDPSVVVIEEPAEPMDADSLALVDDCLTRVAGTRTLLFLARRPATVKAADRVFVLQNGRLAAAGTHDELIAGSELYRLLHFKQTLTAEVEE